MFEPCWRPALPMLLLACNCAAGLAPLLQLSEWDPFTPVQEPVKHGYLQRKQYVHMQCKSEVTLAAPVQESVRHGHQQLSCRLALKLRSWIDLPWNPVCRSG